MNDYFAVVLGDRPGRVCAAVGHGPHRDENGRYRHEDWTEHVFTWPDEQSDLVALATRVATGQPADLYIAPAVRHGNARQRRKGDALPPSVLWADLDQDPADLDLFAELVERGAYVVESGTPGHRHVYLPLTRSIDLGTHARLGRALASRLGGDAKWSDETLLRPPGSFSWKTGKPVLVTARPWNGRRVDPDDVAQLLDVDLSTSDRGGNEERAVIETEPAPSEVPALVRWALRHTDTADRSAACARVIGACRDAGLTPGQTVAVLATYPPAERYREPRHLEDDVARLWGKRPTPETVPGDREHQALSQLAGAPDPTITQEHAVTATPTEPEPQRPPPGKRILRAIRASDVRTRRQRWLWRDRVVLGGLTLLAGREGLGKSTIAADLAARVTRGELDGEFDGEPRSVLYLHTEDARDTTITPRLIASGADLDRVIFVDAVTIDTEGEFEGQVTFPSDVGEIAELAEREGVALVVLDAATSVIDHNLDGDKDRQMRRGLEAIARGIGERADCAVLGIVHFGKRESSDTGRLILGSIAWSQVARSVLAVARDEDAGALVVSATKANLASGDTASLSARLVSQGVQTEDGLASVGRIEWLGETSRNARELLASPADEDKTERREAEAWLEDFLTAEGKTLSRDVKTAARKAGIAERTLTRARQSLGIVPVNEGYPRQSFWDLPADDSPASGATVEPRARGGGPTGPTGPDQQVSGGLTGPTASVGPQTVHGPTDGATEHDEGAVVHELRPTNTWRVSGEGTS